MHIYIFIWLTHNIHAWLHFKVNTQHCQSPHWCVARQVTTADWLIRVSTNLQRCLKKQVLIWILKDQDKTVWLVVQLPVSFVTMDTIRTCGMLNIEIYFFSWLILHICLHCIYDLKQQKIKYNHRTTLTVN